jgi:hypothetical protein
LFDLIAIFLAESQCDSSATTYAGRLPHKLSL